MKIAIAGPGVAGSYLYRLLYLDRPNHEVDLYGLPEQSTECQIHSCAWGVADAFKDLLHHLELNPSDYILRRFDKIQIGEIEYPALFYTIDKPRLITDLQSGTEIRYGTVPMQDYDYIIDATGVARAYLPPPHGGDVRCPTYQNRLVLDRPRYAPPVIFPGKAGYAWVFPLSHTEFHVGAGSLLENPYDLLRRSNLFPLRPDPQHGVSIRCACKSAIRLSGPSAAAPYFYKKVIGVGESIGCVSPIIGEGIVPAMECANVLIDHIRESVIQIPAYIDAVQSTFAWMDAERAVMDKLVSGKRLTIRDGRTVKANAKRMHVDLSIRDMIRFVRMFQATGGSQPHGN